MQCACKIIYVQLIIIVCQCSYYSVTYFTVIGTPTGVTARRSGFNTINVSWMAPSKGPTVASYVVFYQGNGETKNVSGGSTSNTELTLTGLTLGNYSIFVVGFGAKGEPVLPSDPSNVTTITIAGKFNLICTYCIMQLINSPL